MQISLLLSQYHYLCVFFVYCAFCDEEEDVSSYWMTLRKREDTGICKRKQKVAVENSLWKGLWNCKKNYEMNEWDD
jgi:hypothetical protein